MAPTTDLRWNPLVCRVGVPCETSLGFLLFVIGGQKLVMRQVLLRLATMQGVENIECDLLGAYRPVLLGLRGTTHQFQAGSRLVLR